MTERAGRSNGKARVVLIVKAYPWGVLAISVVVNLLIGVEPMQIALPGQRSVAVLTVAALLLLVNHTWLMTVTELTRLRYTLYATPEEWNASGLKPEDASKPGLQELKRCHNAHRNATENTVYFVLLAPLLAFSGSSPLAVQVWAAAFATARLGHTYSYLFGKDNLRGLFMSVSLGALYGMASYAAMGLIV